MGKVTDLASTELNELGEETDEYTETTSKLRDLVKSLTGFDIMEDEDTYKSIYDIIVGIGKEWDNLTDIEQASLGEALAGKRNVNVFYSLMGNVEDLEAAYQTAEESAGSAEKENEAYMESLQYSIDRMKAVAEELSANLLSSDFAKNIINFLEEALSLLNKLLDSGAGIPILLSSVVGIVNKSKDFNLLKFDVNNWKTGTKFLKNLSSSLSLFGKTFDDIKSDIGSQGLSLNAIFGKSGITSVDKSLITNYLSGFDESTTLDTLVNGKSIKDSLLEISDGNNNLSSSAKNTINNIVKENTTIGELNASLKEIPTATTLAKVGIEALGTAIDIFVSFALMFLIQGIFEFISAAGKFTSTVSDLSDSITSLKSDFDDYNEQWKELEKTINDTNSSAEEVADAMASLRELQNTINENYGNGSFVFNEYNPSDDFLIYNQYGDAAEKTEEWFKEIQKAYDWGLDSYVKDMESNNLPTQYGNIDMDDRALITYTDDILEQYKDAMSTWEVETDEAGNVISNYYTQIKESVDAGEESIDTVFGGSDVFNVGEHEVEVAYSPILQTDTGAEFQSSEYMYDYIQNILDKAVQEVGEDASEQDILDEALKLDSDDGKSVGEEYGKNLLAGITDTLDEGISTSDIPAWDIGSLMHFSGDYGALNIAEKSVNNITEALNDQLSVREKLAKQQDNIIKKYDLEADSITDITDSIKYTQELQDLYDEEYQKLLDEFNDNNVFSSENQYSWAESLFNIIANKFTTDQNGDGVKENIDRALESVNDYDSSKFGTTADWILNDYDNILNDVLSKYSNLNFDDDLDLFSTSGNLFDVVEQLTSAQEELQLQLDSMDEDDADYNNTSKALTFVTKQLNDASDALDASKEIWMDDVLNNTILPSDDLTSIYTALQNAYDDYNDAVEEGDSDRASAMKEEFVTAMHDAYETNNEDAIRYFEELYPEFQSEVSSWEFQIDFDANTDNLQGQVRKQLRVLNGMSVEEILNYNGTNEKKIDAISELENIATEYGFGDLSDLFNILENTGVLVRFNNDGSTDYSIRTDADQSAIDSLGRTTYDDRGFSTSGSDNYLRDSNGSALSSDTISKWYDSETTENKSLIKNNTEGFKNLYNYYVDKLGDASQAWKKTLKEMRKSADSTFTDLFEDVNTKSEELSPVDTIYQDVKDGDTFDYSSLTDEDFVSNFGEYTKAYENFLQTIEQSPDDLDACQSAFDDLVTAWMNGENVLGDLTEENKEAIVTLLKQKGIANAEELADSYLNAADDYAAAVEQYEKVHNVQLDSDNLGDATEADINALINEDNKIDETEGYWVAYYMEKFMAQQSFDPTDDLTALDEEIEKLGIAGSKWAQFYKAKAGLAVATAAVESGQETVTMKDAEGNLVTANAQDAMNYFNAIIDSEDLSEQNDTSSEFKAKYTGDKASDSSSSSSSDSDTETIDWLARRADVLASKLDILNSKYEALNTTKKVATSTDLVKEENKNLNEQISLLTKEQKLYKKQKSTYLDKFNKSLTKNSDGKNIDISAYKKAIMNGKYKGKSTDELIQMGIPSDVASAIEEAEGYYDQYLEASQKYTDTIASKLEKKVQKLQNKADLNEQKATLHSTREENAIGATAKNSEEAKSLEYTKKQYAYLIKIAKKQKDTVEEKRLEAELQQKIVESYKTMSENISTATENEISGYTNGIDLVSSYMTLAQTNGHINTQGYYEEQKNMYSKKTPYLEAELQKQKDLLASYTGQVGDDGWIAINQAIWDAKKALVDNQNSIDGCTQAIRENTEEIFDDTIAQEKRVTSELSFFSDLIDEDDWFDNETHATTDAYTLSQSILAAKFTSDTNTLKKLQDERDVTYQKMVNEEDGYSLDNKDNWDRLNELDDQIESAYNDRKADIEEMESMISSMFDEFKEGISDLISDYEDGLDNISDLRDYQENIKDKTDTVTSLQQQITALGGDTSEENRARLQQLSADLSDAQEDLDDTIYDQWKSDQKKMLSNLEDGLEDYIENLDLKQMAIDALETIQGTDSTTLSDLNDYLKAEYGLATSFLTYTDANGNESTYTLQSYMDAATAKADEIVSKYSQKSTSGTDGSQESGSEQHSSEWTALSGYQNTVTLKQSDYDSNNTSQSGLVEAVKAGLNKLGYDAGSGKGWNTSKDKNHKLLDALTKFKKENGISGTGLSIGSGTVQKLMELIGYKTGGQDIDDLYAWTQEEGSEIIRRSDGALLTPTKGATVFTNDQTQALWDLSKAILSGVSTPTATALDSSAYTNSSSNSTAMFTIGDINMVGVNDPETFAQQLKDAINNNTTVQKTLQASTVNLLNKNYNSLSGRRY